MVTRPPGVFLPALSMARRELVRFVRQRSRLVGAFATPIVFWLFIGLGMGRSFTGDGAVPTSGYIAYFFPGTILMIVLFTAIFSTISVIEDRREGFLQSVLVSPVSRASIVLGKILGGTSLATIQASLFLSLGPLIGVSYTLASLCWTIGIILLLSFALTGLGFIIAWSMESTQGFHAVMNLLLMPMWFLSGALFPVSGAMGGIGWLMRLNPLTYGHAALQATLHSGGSVSWTTPAPFTMNILVTLAFAAAMFVTACVVASRPSV